MAYHSHRSNLFEIANNGCFSGWCPETFIPSALSARKINFQEPRECPIIKGSDKEINNYTLFPLDNKAYAVGTMSTALKFKIVILSPVLYFTYTAFVGKIPWLPRNYEGHNRLLLCANFLEQTFWNTCYFSCKSIYTLLKTVAYTCTYMCVCVFNFNSMCK